MHLPVPVLFVFASSSYHALASSRRAPARIAVSNNILHLKSIPSAPHLIPPSSKHLAVHRNDLQNANTKRQDIPVAKIQEDLLTLGGRVYMTEVTLADKIFTLVIDTGSSDTWVVSSSFQCLNPDTFATLPTRYCGFNSSYNPNDSPTWSSIPSFDFAVNYTGGEFLQGEMGTERLGVGDVSLGKEPGLEVTQTIGVVEQGYWMGDGVSSGLMGLAYPALVSGARRLGYSSVMFTLTQEESIPSVFSLALDRPTDEDLAGGGMLAIGGIPDIPHDGDFVTVPIQTVHSSIYAYYSILTDGFDITPPSTSISRISSTHKSSNSRVRNHHTPTQESERQRNSATEFLGPTTMIVDSGSSLVYFPDPVADYIASLFSPPASFNSNSGMYIVPCDAAAPRVGIIIGGKSFFIHEDDLMNKGPGAVGGPSVGASRGNCALAVQRAGRGSLVLGDTWMKNVLVVFDLGENELRVAAREKY